MAQKALRRLTRNYRRNEQAMSKKHQELKLEALEPRLLLDVSGWWDEMGWRSASGGAVTWDLQDPCGDAQLVLSGDGDPVVLWVESDITQVGSTDVGNTHQFPYQWQTDGEIYARQYADELGWWDLYPGSGDTTSIGTGKQLAAASGPDGMIAAAWVTGSGDTSEIYVKVWRQNPTTHQWQWMEMNSSASGGGVSNDEVQNSKPDLVFNSVGELFVSYTATHPTFGEQTEIVVKKISTSNLTSSWTELTNGLPFGQELASGVSADNANSFDSAITVDNSGRPVVAWTTLRGENQADIYVKRWDGSEWTEYGVGSASDPDANGQGGISNDVGMSIQPDIAAAINGDVIVTWVNWSNWNNYNLNGNAGIFVKYLEGEDIAGDVSTAQWQAYQGNAAYTTGAGIAGDGAIGEPGYGWYYQPTIDVDDQSQPVIAWQGYSTIILNPEGYPERTALYYYNNDFERISYPFTTVYARYYNNGDTNDFEWLTDYISDANEQLVNSSLDAQDAKSNYEINNTRYTAGIPDHVIKLPAVLIKPIDDGDDVVLLAYTWDDQDYLYGQEFGASIDHEIFVQQWGMREINGAPLADWVQYGRGSNSHGNDVFTSEDVDRRNSNKLALIDIDGNPTTEHDVVLGIPNTIRDPEDSSALFYPNGGQLYLYSRTTDTWSPFAFTGDSDTDEDPAFTGFGTIFDLRGEPEIEAGEDVQGPPLLAFLDDDTGLPYVYQYVNGEWDLLAGAGPDGAVTDIVGNLDHVDSDSDFYTDETSGISVQAGPNGTALLVYVANRLNGSGLTSDHTVAYIWNGSAWEAAGLSPSGTGLLPKETLLGPEYYSDFNAITFDDVELEDAARNDVGVMSPVPAPNTWYFIPDRRYDDLTLAEVSAEGGQTWVEDGPDDFGIVISITDPDNEQAVIDNVPVTLTTQVVYAFEMASDNHALIELAYAMTLPPGGPSVADSLKLYIYIDGVLWDITEEAPDDLITPFHAGAQVYTDSDAAIPLDTDLMDLEEVLDAGEIDLEGLVDPDTGKLLRGKHTLTFEVTMNVTGADVDPEPGDAQVFLDNIAIYPKFTATTIDGTGNTDWLNPATNPTADPPLADGNDDAVIYSSLDAGGGTQEILIPDILHAEDGDLVIQFRCSLSTEAPLPVTTAVWVDISNSDGDNVLSSLLDFGEDYDDGASGWQYQTITLENADSDIYDLTITLVGVDVSDLWIDNLTVLATQRTYAYIPQATLLATGDANGSTRNFAVSQATLIQDYYGYTDNDDDPIPDAFVTELCASGLYELSNTSNTWSAYGELLYETTPISFLGITDAVVEMPVINNFYTLEDMAVGPNALEWIVLQNYITEGWDLDEDGYNETLYSYWNDVQVWRWDPFVAEPKWVDTNLPLDRAEDNYFLYPQIVSNAGQRVTVAWTNYRYGIRDTSARRFESNGTWGVLGTESVQNGQGWSALSLQNMIVREDGYPIVAFYIGHMSVDGIREFRPDNSVPDMAITGDDLVSGEQINFGLAQNIMIAKDFTIKNNATATQTERDLFIYDMEFGGLSSLPEEAFTILGNPEFPLAIEPGQEREFTVVFDPTVEGVEPGFYNVVLLVHSNSPDHPTHSFSHFYELLLTVEVINDTEITVEPTPLIFPNTVVSNVSTAQELTLRNDGTDPLTVSEWFFDGTNFTMVGGSLVRIDPETQEETIVDLSPLTNSPGSSDDVVLEPNEYIVFEIQFAPDELAVFTQTFYVVCDDWDEPIVSTTLSGKGVSGAAITVTDSYLTPDDDLIDFGSVVFGAQSSSYTATITNSGVSDLTISQIVVTPASNVLLSPNTSGTIVLGPDESYTVTLVYAPIADPLAPYETSELTAELRIFNDNPDDELNPYTVTLMGLGIPNVPVVDITEESPDAEGANDNRLVFNAVAPTPVDATTTQVFTLANLGNAELDELTFTYEAWNFTTFRYEPVDAGDYNPFSTSPETDTFLPLSRLDGPVDITVSFTPEESGNYYYRLTMAYQQEGNDAFKVLDLWASASNPELEVTDSQGSSTDQLVDFGQFGIGQTKTYTVTMKNIGTSAFTITNWALAGDVSGVFDVTDFTTADELSPGEKITLTVTFNPVTAGSYEAQLQIGTDIFGSELQTVLLTGEGLLPGSGLISDSQGNPDDGVINFTPEAPIISGQTTMPATITIFNNGGDDLLIKSIAVTSKFFVIDTSQVPAELGPNEGAVIPVTFNPGGGMDNTNNPAKVIIVTNDQTGEADQTAQVLLYGRATAATSVGGANIRQTMQAENGELVTVTLIGPGTAQIIPLTDGTNHVDKLLLSGTTTQTMLLVSASGNAVFGGIEGASLGMLLARNITFNDEGINLTALGRMISGGNLSGGADITIAQTGSSGIMMLLGQVGDGSDVTVNGDVTLFLSQSFGNGTFFADDVSTFLPRNSFGGNMHLTGNLKTALLSGSTVPGNFIIDGTLNMLFASSATLTGAINAGAIGTIRFGNIVGADISTAGRIQSLNSSRDLIDSRILAGYDLGTDGRLGGVGDAADQLFSGGVISQVSIQRNIEDSFISAGIAPTGTNFLNASATAIGNVGTVRLGGHVDNGTPYGVSAATGISSVTLGLERVQINQSVGDFEVRLLD